MTHLDQLDQLLRDTLAERADEAPHPAPVTARAVQQAGRPRGRQRTLVAASIGTVAASAAVLATAVGWPSPSTTTGAADAPPAGPASVLERCTTLGADALAPDHWGPGSRVLTSATAGARARAVLLSADGRQWADCQLLAPGQGIVSTYPIEPARQGAVEMSGYTMATEGPLSFSWADRFPDNVAEVRLVFESGRTVTADAVDGFVAVELTGTEPDELDTVLQYDEDGRLVGGPDLAPGDADLPLDQRSLVPREPLATVEHVDGQ